MTEVTEQGTPANATRPDQPTRLNNIGGCDDACTPSKPCADCVLSGSDLADVDSDD